MKEKKGKAEKKSHSSGGEGLRCLFAFQVGLFLSLEVFLESKIFTAENIPSAPLQQTSCIKSTAASWGPAAETGC